MPNIPRPCKEEVEEYIKNWYDLENYVNQENSLNKLFFDLIPENKLIEDILKKASTLNDFYSTNIFSIFPVAKHIHELDINERLQKGDLSLVEDIANVGELNKRFYSLPANIALTTILMPFQYLTIMCQEYWSISENRICLPNSHMMI